MVCDSHGHLLFYFILPRLSIRFEILLQLKQLFLLPFQHHSHFFSLHKNVQIDVLIKIHQN